MTRWDSLCWQKASILILFFFICCWIRETNASRWVLNTHKSRFCILVALSRFCQTKTVCVCVCVPKSIYISGGVTVVSGVVSSATVTEITAVTVKSGLLLLKYKSICTQLNNSFPVMRVRALKIPFQSFSVLCVLLLCKIKTYMLLWCGFTSSDYISKLW